MNLFNKLSDTDKYAINSYINANVEECKGERADLSYLLRYWDENKSAFLYKLLGEKFIVEKDVLVTKSSALLEEEMGDALYNGPIRRFKQNVLRFFESGRYVAPANLPGVLSSEAYYYVQGLFGTKNLVRNEYSGENFTLYTPDNHKIAIVAGCRPVKMLGKIASAFDIEGYEEFRLAHSLITNQKTLKGKLCLSIHPLDFMTMSDNDCDWDSCMSWIHRGCYRRGTVEMMNSDCVLVAYLSAEDPFVINGFKWSNKKWRILVNVTKDFIMTIKGYPYQSDELSNLVLDMIKDLAKDNLDYYYDDNFSFEHETRFTFKDEDYFVSMSTDTMYNDCGTCIHHGCFNKSLTKDKKCSPNTTKWSDYHNAYKYSCNYSGVATCMWCGETYGDYEDEGQLCCNSCYSAVYCYNCGDAIDEDDALELDGELYCRYCYDEYASYDPIDDEYHHRDNFTNVYVVPDGYVEACKAIGKSPNFAQFGVIPIYRYHINYCDSATARYFGCDREYADTLFKEYVNTSVWYHPTFVYINFSDINDSIVDELNGTYTYKEIEDRVKNACVGDEND